MLIANNQNIFCRHSQNSRSIFNNLGEKVKLIAGAAKDVVKDFPKHPLFYTLPSIMLAATGAAFCAPIIFNVALRGLTDKQRQEIKKTIQPGDIILRLEQYEMPALVPMAIFAGAEYAHAMIAKDKEHLIEAGFGSSGLKVDERETDKLITPRTMELAILRPKYETKEQKEKTIEYLQQQLGKPFDLGFNLEENGKFYCTKLIYFALKNAGVISSAPITHVLGKNILLPRDFLHTDGVNVVKKFHGQ